MEEMKENYMHVEPDSQFYTDLEQILNSLRLMPEDVAHICIGIENTIKRGYKLTRVPDTEALQRWLREGVQRQITNGMLELRWYEGGKNCWLVMNEVRPRLRHGLQDTDGGEMKGEVMAAQYWKTNSEMMADVARLGYLMGSVFDATYGEGTFWSMWQPLVLATNDLYKPAEFKEDYRKLHFADKSFDAVVFDPPYKLNGTPALGEMDKRYGVEKRVKRQDRMENIRAGAIECYRVSKTYLLVKCQDQVEGGRVRWQSDMITEAITQRGGIKVDEFQFLMTPRPQPGKRQQRTARRNYSTLLIFEKPEAK